MVCTRRSGLKYPRTEPFPQTGADGEVGIFCRPPAQPLGNSNIQGAIAGQTSHCIVLIEFDLRERENPWRSWGRISRLREC